MMVGVVIAFQVNNNSSRGTVIVNNGLLTTSNIADNGPTANSSKQLASVSNGTGIVTTGGILAVGLNINLYNGSASAIIGPGATFNIPFPLSGGGSYKSGGNVLTSQVQPTMYPQIRHHLRSILA